MEDEEINYRTLRKIQQMEKNSPLLTDLKSSFYTELSEFFQGLNERLKNESSSQKLLLIKDEMQNTKKIAINIYEQREKKILLAAISKARGGNPDLKNLIDVEKELYDSILNLMMDSRKQFLEKEKQESVANEKSVVGNNKNEETDDKQNNSNPIVRVTEDIPEFVGTDEKKYSLRKNDLLSLPDDMSDMLLKRGVVEKIE
jgi:DNA replication initiation complex subunit (GINS family)